MGQQLSAEEVDNGCYIVFKFKYKWIIPKFRELATKTAVGTSTSQAVNLKMRDKIYLFQLLLYTHGYNERVSNYLSLFLKRDSTDEMLIQFSCLLEDCNGKEIKVKSIKQKLSIDSHLGWMLYCRRDFVLNDENTILNDGNLTLNCEIEIFENKAITNTEIEVDDPYMEASVSKMSTDMIDLLREGEFSDISIRVESQVFPVHRSILSARSAVFKTMMKSPWQKDLKEIVISDIKVEAVKQMLLYIYSGVIGSTDVETTQELYYAADKYELHDLKGICNKILVQNLDINNAIDILLLGYRHSDDGLQYSSIEYMAKNASTIHKKSEWMNFMKNYPELANLVFHNHLNKS